MCAQEEEAITDYKALPPENTFQHFPTDPRISYPGYKAMDEFIDVERLTALDGYVTARLKKHLNTASVNDQHFYTGPYRLRKESLSVPGCRMIYLSQSERPDCYFDLDKTALWQLTDAAKEFSMLMEFIRTLPFRATGRMLIVYDTELRPIPAHRDHLKPEICHDFIWFRTNKRKPMYMLNHLTGDKVYIESCSAWFDTVNQFHGSEGCDGLSFSIRVDGTFTDSFKQQIPRPPHNAASTPSYWDALSKQ